MKTFRIITIIRPGDEIENKMFVAVSSGKMKRTPIDAIAYGFSQSVQFLVNAAVFAFGAYLIKEHGLSFESMFK